MWYFITMVKLPQLNSTAECKKATVGTDLIIGLTFKSGSFLNVIFLPLDKKNNCRKTSEKCGTSLNNQDHKKY